MLSSNFVISHYFLLLVISKFFCKMLVSLRLFQFLKISDLVMAKDEKVNIAKNIIKITPKNSLKYFFLEIGE
jgi:hypothetical protein